ncbi:ATPase family associated with various cellular activities (AAA) [Pseudoxanthomonas sp. CF385]|uniref:AAA family ATPase n=1 Tax=Pseudoxanthomonas TaxID=83618 RepID=UPI000881EF08|nr:MULTISPECIES: ATP-binding protein [Pseudoxanthomonas]KAF1728068.1 AAA family ATPase [Pseudoxanthomonas mexicana]MCH2093401.1 ATP-binding protein [Pseudoxanthomonas sp.]WBX94931.1 ATP-binding protein [Pseudoxanthomonas mexicana]SDQ20590.1 ATPase family associated with various cellular activities (AAA) [Pseudoxanthomonas sp. CF385]
MSRADLIVNLVKAGSEGDQQLFRTTVEAMAAEERAKQHHQLADRLVQNLKSATPRGRTAEVIRAHDGGHGGLLYEIDPARSLDSMLLSEGVRAACRELIEEQQRRDLLRSYGLEPRHRMLLSGAPGNGKTSLAEAVAHELMAPLFVVRYEAVIGSFLGETSSRLKRLFDFVRTHQCVLFFDEFDTLGKERGDTHETGEIKRVVSSLLLQIDALPSHVVVITATNHAELLDRAVWRRFQLRLEMPAPTLEQKEDWFRRLQEKLEAPLGITPKSLAAKLNVGNFSDLEQFCEDVQRRYVLSLPNANLKAILQERLKQWQSRFSVVAQA